MMTDVLFLGELYLYCVNKGTELVLSYFLLFYVSLASNSSAHEEWWISPLHWYARASDSCPVQLVRLSGAAWVEGTIKQAGAGTTAILALIAWQTRLSLTHAESQYTPQQALPQPHGHSKTGCAFALRILMLFVSLASFLLFSKSVLLFREFLICEGSC